MGGPTGGATSSEGEARPTRSVAVLAVAVGVARSAYRRIEGRGSVRRAWERAARNLARKSRFKPDAHLTDGRSTMLSTVSSVTNMPMRPDPRRAPHPYALNARVSAAQYGALLLVAEQLDASVSAALRLMIDEWIERQPEDLRRALGMAESVAPDPEWAERHQRGAA
jgi:hypothetical protein